VVASARADDADLLSIHAKVSYEALAPLLEERLAIDDHERGHRAMGDGRGKPARSCRGRVARRALQIGEIAPRMRL